MDCRALGPEAATAWHQQDFLSFAAGCCEDFDVMLMSFALHHLQEADKAALIQQAHRLLKARRAAFLAAWPGHGSALRPCAHGQDMPGSYKSRMCWLTPPGSSFSFSFFCAFPLFASLSCVNGMACFAQAGRICDG
jgi:hypothetical protein